ncbi:hypothetical protein GCM10018785_13560 [Streptomyces longispororuber]|uniref:Uncharacterized protein n=1 Tax=Streptomyces longispororuber TaxID=68230 RepID=A0A918ZCK5_9ACTN|nr:hypothetical protein [Streptomyces longispororuber]GHE45217.1 hypothetical protein GCM10018785_13560 [Streptomyces longispororuber]
MAFTTALAAGLLTACGGDGDEGPPEEVAKAVEKQCAGRIDPDGLDMGLADGVKQTLDGRWERDGAGGCVWSAQEDGRFWTPVDLDVIRVRSPAAARKDARTFCDRMREDTRHHAGYVDKGTYCAAYENSAALRAHVAHGAVGPYRVELTLSGPRPLKDEHYKAPRERIAHVLDDVRAYYEERDR